MKSLENPRVPNEKADKVAKWGTSRPTLDMLNRFSKVVSHNNQPHCLTPFPIGREQTNRSLFDHPHFGFWVKMQNGEKFYPKNLNCEAFCLHGRRLFWVAPFGGCVYKHHGSMLQAGICLWRSGCKVCIFGTNGATPGAYLTCRVSPKPAWMAGYLLNLPWRTCLSLFVVWGPFLRASSVRMAFWGILIFSLTGREVLKGFQALRAHIQSLTR